MFIHNFYCIICNMHVKVGYCSVLGYTTLMPCLYAIRTEPNKGKMRTRDHLFFCKDTFAMCVDIFLLSLRFRSFGWMAGWLFEWTFRDI